MSHREMLTKQLQDGIDEASAVGLCNLFRIYNVREPLIDAIKRGESYLWKSEQVRELMAEALAGFKKQKGRPANLDIESRNFAIMCELHYLFACGIPLYADSKKEGKTTACEIVAARRHLHEETVKQVWKEKKNDDHPLYATARKAGKHNKGG